MADGSAVFRLVASYALEEYEICILKQRAKLVVQLEEKLEHRERFAVVGGEADFYGGRRNSGVFEKLVKFYSVDVLSG